jgi:hypothetical protein
MMRKNGVFWGSMIILLGLVLLLNSMGLLPGNFWSLFWPMVMIMLGLWYLIRPVIQRGAMESQTLTLPLDAASSAEVKIRHGVGKLTVGAAAGSSNLLEGTFEGGMNHEIQRDEAHIILKLKADAPDFFFGLPPAPGFRGICWDLFLNPIIPLTLDIKSGASETKLNLEGLKVTVLDLETGASSNEITLPAAAGVTMVRIKSGAASIHLRLPPGVAGRIRHQGGLSSIKIDPQRFPFNGQVYETPGFINSPNRSEIMIESGVGSIEVN